MRWRKAAADDSADDVYIDLRERLAPYSVDDGPGGDLDAPVEQGPRHLVSAEAFRHRPRHLTR